MIIETYEQRTAEWYAARCGVITASGLKRMLTKPRSKGGISATRQSYLMELVAERITGKPTESYKSWAMERGIELEPFAFRAYCMATDEPMRNVGFIYMDDARRVGCSPDGITMLGDGGVEIKCPEPKAHMRYLDGDTEAREHAAQVQGSMYITGTDWWDLVSFCPEFDAAPLVINRVARDPDKIAEIARECCKALQEIDAMYAAVCRTVVSDATAGICTEALEHLDSINSSHGDGIPEAD